MQIKDFDQLRVYQQAFKAAMRIFELSQNWPKEERYALTDQIRRSSRAVCSNLAEAWAKRRYERHFVSKLTDAEGEAAETQVWLRFALQCAYLEEPAYRELEQAVKQIRGGLINMMRQPEKWCGPTHIVREEETPYNED